MAVHRNLWHCHSAACHCYHRFQEQNLAYLNVSLTKEYILNAFTAFSKSFDVNVQIEHLILTKYTNKLIEGSPERIKRSFFRIKNVLFVKINHCFSIPAQFKKTLLIENCLQNWPKTKFKLRSIFSSEQISSCQVDHINYFRRVF
jgi:hypothetical protein